VFKVVPLTVLSRSDQKSFRIFSENEEPRRFWDVGHARKSKTIVAGNSSGTQTDSFSESPSNVTCDPGNAIETHQNADEGEACVHSAAELRQKVRDWLAKSAVDRIREDPEAE